MNFSFLDNLKKAVEYKPLLKPEPKPSPQPESQPLVETNDAKKINAQYVGANNRLQLEKKLPTEKPTPYGALENIKKLPKPDASDPAAVKAYKQKVAGIANDAINNSEPPNRQTYLDSGLNGRTADWEYQEAKRYYDSQINQLKNYAEDAKKYPDKILTPGEAVIEIDKLPRPDRNDPQAVKEYNTKRAAIAEAALLYAKPPKREDFNFPGLNAPTRDMEFRDALSSYNSSVAKLKDYSSVDGTSVLPLMTEEEVTATADSYIKNHNGVKNEDDAYGVGKDIAELAKTDPESAALVMKEVQEKLNSTDYGDNVASGFVQNSSVEEIRKFGETFEGEMVLKDLQNRLTSGSVHEDEYKESAKITEALTGFNSNSLTGDPEKDAKTVDEQLNNLPPDMRDEYVKELLNHPFGQNAIRYAAVMSPEGSEMLGKALGELYKQNPTETAALLKQITNAENIGMYPYYYQSGLARAIAKSGNDDLIKSFAQNEIDRAKSDPNEIRGYLNAASAYAGLSPEALQDVMKNNPDFYKTIEEAGKLTGGPASSGGFENGNIWEPGLGELLEKASKIKGADGKATPESIKLFETLVNHAGSNFRTMEGLGAFFVEHAQQLVDKYTNPEDPNALTSTVLRDFFAKVIYSPIGSELRYNGGSLVEAVMGNEKGEGGVIGDVVQTYLDAANKVPNDGEKDDLLGQRIGILWAGMSNGFLDMVQSNKDKWKEDKEFRDFTINALSFGLGKIADKFGVPGEVVDKPLELVQKMLDSKAEKDQKAQIDAFKTAFKEFNTAMYAKLNTYDQKNPNVENMNTGFTKAYNLLTINQIIDKQIES